ncbi:MAG: hypothetical protein IJB79_05775 [Candidatus Gastranaerophilales bacterium]|nr:hypothetical protein [Candidatus Gastranaerophilales bacterium]
MAITLGTNIPSYTARVNLNTVTSKLTDTMEKLSTGLKINRAGDDAAGLVISENMEALIRGSKQAQNNIQNATSFLTIAEDGMVSIGDHFQRINDLLVNMANDTNDIDSRTAAVREIIERLDEINRLAESTNFNGKTMLDGSVDSIIVQMGPDETSSSILDISEALTDCHVESLKAILPGNLNPDALKLDNGDIIIPKEEIQDDGSIATKYYYEKDGAEYNGATTGLESAFDPTNENCRNYMASVQNAISELSTRRGLLGAYENRMDSSYDSLSTRIESLESAKSIYTDTDIAQEATNMTTQQIMQQYNVALLANANTIPQLALQLIG